MGRFICAETRSLFRFLSLFAGAAGFFLRRAELSSVFSDGTGLAEKFLRESFITGGFTVLFLFDRCSCGFVP
jgi:hypothetical protein